MSDLISRQYAIYELRDLIIEPDISDDEIKIEGYNEGLETAISLLSVLSSALPDERTAKVMSDGINYCGNCEGYVEAPMAYCPYCGAKLEWK